MAKVTKKVTKKRVKKNVERGNLLHMLHRWQLRQLQKQL